MFKGYRAVSIIAAVFLGLLVIACGSGSSTTGSPAAGSAAATSAPGASAATAPAAPAEPTAAPAASGPANVGDRVAANGIALTVTKVDRADTLGQFLKAKDGNTFVVAEVLIENTGTEKAPYNPLYFTVKDADGFEYNSALGVDQQLGSGELDAGGKSRGNVAFEVKKGAKGLILTYKPLVLLSNDQPIRVAIPDA